MHGWIFLLAYLQGGEVVQRYFEFAQLAGCNSAQLQFVSDFAEKRDAQLLVAECVPVSKTGLRRD